MPLWRKSSARIVAAVLCMLAFTFMLRVWYLEEQGNFHAITPGEAYRSAQLDRDELEHYVRKYHIRSIINLRGEQADRSWYREETAAARDLGVRHFDFGEIGATRPPTAGDLDKLLALIARVPRPVLLHCRAGADRSGLAAAVWKAVVDGEPASEARRQLSLRYGHIPMGPTQALDTFFDAWASASSEGKARMGNAIPRDPIE